MIEGNSNETTTITVQGKPVTVPQPFAPGYKLRENDASVLNQTYAENIRNNLSATVKAAVEAKKSEKEIQALVDEYVKAYDFGVRTGGGRSADPVQVEAMNIARQKVREALKKQGVKVSDVPAADINKAAKDAIATYPKIMEMAKQMAELKAKAVAL
jgi:hypothetical protein